MTRLFLLILSLSACKPYTLNPIGKFEVTSQGETWTWDFRTDGKLYEAQGQEGGCGEWYRVDGVYYLTSGLLKATLRGEMKRTGAGWEYVTESEVFNLKEL